jgi:5'-nucleotidase
MPFDLTERFVVAVSTRALFDLSKENEVFNEHGLEAYEAHQRKHETTILEPGTAFPLVKALFELNEFLPPHRHVEVIFFSRNSATTSLRAWKSAEHYQLPITRGAFTSGRSVAKYADDYHVDLLLSAESRDVDEALRMHIPAALVMGRPRRGIAKDSREIRIAFDGDAVLFDGASEQIFQASGIDAFHSNEKEHAHEPLGHGPMATLMTSLAILRRNLPPEAPRIVIGLITAPQRSRA